MVCSPLQKEAGADLVSDKIPDMSIRCHLCSHRFETDSTEDFVRCPRCEAKLKNKSKKASSTQKRSQTVGCPGCLKTFQSSQSFPLTCRYCGTSIEEEISSKIAELLQGFEANAVAMLLNGEKAQTIAGELQQNGVHQDPAYKYVHRLLNELPFHRFLFWESQGKAKPPTECDNCGVQQPLTAYEAHWILDQEQLRYRPDWGGFTGEFGKLENYDKQALYYLCKTCKKTKPDKLGGGYPASAGYVLKRKLKTPKNL